MLDDRLRGRDGREIAYAFHAAVAGGVVAEVRRLCHEERLSTVALSGGVFQNELLLRLMCEQLAASPAIRVLTNHQVPAGDGGISLGQIALAAVAARE